MKFQKRHSVLFALLAAAGCGSQPAIVSPLQPTYEMRLAEAADMAEEVGRSLQRHTAAQVIELTKQRIADSMRDPESARFRSVKLIDYEGKTAVCGELNAKNAYGGYVGYRPFIASASSHLIVEDMSSAMGAAESAGYRRHCLLGAARE